MRVILLHVFYDPGHSRQTTQKHGRWQSIMGEIGSLSHTCFPLLSLKHTVHRQAHTHTHFANTLAHVEDQRHRMKHGLLRA